VLEAENGVQALEILDQENKCDLVVSDIIMPEMNGMELFRELKKKALPVKVMLISGHNDELISPQELVESNITLLKKPFQSDIFVKTIRKVLDTPMTSASI
jgi:DNA-binding NtrC family response regulator